MSLKTECLKHILGPRVAHITYISKDATHSTAAPESPAPTKANKLKSANGSEGTSEIPIYETSEEKFGSLIPVSNIKTSNKLQIYVDRGIQAGSPCGIFQQTPSTDDLSINVRLTYDLVDQYVENLYKAKNAIFKLPSYPTLPDDVWTDILTNRFVDIGRIHLAYTTHPANYIITSFGEWYKAFEAYEAGVCLAFPHRKEEFNTWRNSVVQLFGRHSESEHRAVIRTESVNRQAIFDRRKQSLDDQQCITDLQSTIVMISPSGIGKSANHVEKKEKPAKKKDYSPGICQKWNGEGCKLGEGCRYKHVCRKCQSEEHKGKECTVRKTGAKLKPERTVS